MGAYTILTKILNFAIFSKIYNGGAYGGKAIYSLV